MERGNEFFQGSYTNDQLVYQKVQHHWSSGKCKSRWQYYLISVRIVFSKRQEKTSIGEDVEKKNLSALLLGM